MQDKQNTFQNALQNAGQLQSFSYAEIGNQTSTWLVLILALIIFSRCCAQKPAPDLC